MKRFAILSLMFIVLACGQEEQEVTPAVAPPKPLPGIANVSLTSSPSDESVTVGRNIEAEGAEVSLMGDAYWIKNLRISKDKVLFSVEENPNRQTGHRFDTILISVRNIRIGSICVTQARDRKAPEKMQWAKNGATYATAMAGDYETSGKEITRFIYELEKTTNGADSYKNYPAFAYCIEMNHDPENNLEWYLPSQRDLPDVRFYPDFDDMYYWTATSLHSNYAILYRYNASYNTKKTDRAGVYAFRENSGIE